MIEQDLITSIVAKLIAGPTDAGASIYPMRYKYADLTDLPMIAVYDAEMISANNANEMDESRQATIEIMLFAYGPQTPATIANAADTKIMTLRGQVEAILGGMYDDLGVDGINSKEYNGYRIIDDKNNKDSENLVLTCAMRYSFKYFNSLVAI